MKRFLFGVAFAVGFCVVPRIATAAPCSPSHTFTTGETLTATIMNSNPVTFSGCFNNLDNANIGSAGIYASQIKPTNGSQATFGSSIQYTFQGGLNSLNTVNATVGAGTAFSTNASDGQPVLLFPSNSASNETSIGVNTSSSFPYLSIAQLSSGGSFQRWLLGIDGSGNLSVPNGSVTTPNNLVFGGLSTGGTLSGSTGNISHSGNLSTGGTASITGMTTTNGISNASGNISNSGNYQGKYGSGTSYVIPFDANSVSGQNGTHIEHGSITTGAFSGGFACSSSQSFIKPFDATPDISLTMVGDAASGLLVKPYINSRSASAFTACAESTVAATGTVTFSWQAMGE